MTNRSCRIFHGVAAASSIAASSVGQVVLMLVHAVMFIPVENDLAQPIWLTHGIFNQFG